MKRSKQHWRGLAIVLGSVALSWANLSASPSDAAVVQNPDNGHFYEFVPGYLTWSQARDAAASQSHQGLPGYLVTITSQSEQTFIEQLLEGVSFPPADDFPQIWLGGSDAAQEGVWNWVTGPEAGTQFWQGDFTGSPVGGAYDNWETVDGVRRQPDDSGDEDFLSIEFNPAPGPGSISDEKYQWNDSSAGRVGVGYLVEYSGQEVTIDIKPGSVPNPINPRSRGKIPVAILTTDSFNATTVDPTTVLFGVTGTEAAPVHFGFEDVDGDGDTDMILHFNTQETGIECGDTSAFLIGETLSGQAIQGADSIKTVGCK